MKRFSPRVLAILGFALLFAAFLVSLLSGSAALSPGALWHALCGGFSGASGGGGDGELLAHTVLWELRLPRACLAAATGAALALAGLLMQAVFINPLADPYIVGAASGASLGAALAILFGLTEYFCGQSWVALCAFAGALAAVALAWRVAGGVRRTDPYRLLLVGVGLGMLVSALTSLLMLLSRPALEQAFFWLVGGFAAAGWGPLPPLLVCLALALWLGAPGMAAMNLLLLGDDSAARLGADPARLRKRLIILATLLTGAAVAAAGVISFVGLMVPHALRRIAGPDHRRLFWLTPLYGAAALTLADGLARWVGAHFAQGREIPVGVITAAIGVPVMLVLLRKKS